MLRVTVFQARRQRFAGPATQVVLPAEAGEVSILRDHAPMLCVLRDGTLWIDDHRLHVRTGLARVARNAVTILMES